MAAGTVTATSLQLGKVGSGATNPLNTKGTLTLTGGSFTVNGNVSNEGGTATIQLASSTLTGATFTVTGNITDPSGTMNLYADGGTMTVTGSVAADNLRVGYNGLTASATFSSGAVVIGSGTGTNLYVGRRDADVGGTQGVQFKGTLNLAGATSVTINVATFGIGTAQPVGGGQGYPVGEVTLSPNNTITADTIRVAHSEGVGMGGVNKLTFGTTNVVNADTVIFGGSKGTAQVTIVPGGTLTLQGKTGTRANLYVGYQPVWAGGGATGTLDLSAGTFTAALDQLVIAQKEATGTGTTTGTMIVGLGTVTANQITLANRNGTGNAIATLTIRGGNWTVSGSVAEPANGGSSTLNLDSGTMTISGNISVDKLRVGHDPVPSATATLTVQGNGTVRIGSGSSDDLSVGWRESANNTGAFYGTLDLSGASSAVIDVGTFGVGYVTGGSGEFSPTGTVILSPNNTITADTIYVAHSTTVGLGGRVNKLTFGTTNVVNADTVIFGGSKGIAQVDIVPGGTLTLQGKTGTRANLYVGYQPVWTGGGANGTLDLSAGTFNAALDQLVIAQKEATGTGTTQGTLKFEAGHIDVNSILLGTKSGGGGSAIGTFIMNGGTLTAGSIAQGDGTGVFQFNAGTLHVGTFGTETIPFDLSQAGGTLAPGTSIGATTIYGNYNQAAPGTLEIELAGLTSYDTVTVYGNADLNGTLLVKFLDGYAPGLGDTFNILSAFGTIDISNLDLLGDQPPNSRWLVNLLSGQGGGEILQLQVALPEPSTWILALLALGSLGLLKRLNLLPRA